MQEVLEFILKNITTTPDDVKVESIEENGVINFTISVHLDDVGRIIGKEGKVIKAIRTIMRVIAIQKGVRVRVSVLSDNDNKPATQTEEVITVDEAPEIVAEPEPEVEITPEPAPEPTPEVAAIETPTEDSLTVEV